VKDLLIYNARLVDRDMDVRGALLVRDGKISAVYPDETGHGAAAAASSAQDSAGPDVYDAHGAALMPAFVDLHAHFRDPGYTRKEDLLSGSQAAAAGGYGTVVLMANTKPVISTQSGAAEVNGRAREIGIIDAFQAVSLTRNFDGADTTGLDDLDSAVVPLATEDGREVASATVMLEAMKKCALRGVIVSCHSEDPELAAAAKIYREAALKVMTSRLGGQRQYGREVIHEKLSAAGRLLRLAEDTMTVRNLALAAEAGGHVHIAHVSTTGSLDAVRRAKASLAAAKGGIVSGDGRTAPGSTAAAGGRVTCEVTPHHLALTDNRAEIVNPPLRGDADRESLIEGLIDGTVDAIATDHAPHTAEDKDAGAPGFSGIETAFSLCNTALVITGRLSLSRLSELMSANPAEILSLNRGLLRAGFDADLTIVDPDVLWAVDTADGGRWFSRGKNSPLAGEQLYGRVLATFKRGRKVFGD